MEQEKALKEECTPKEEIASKPYDPGNETRSLLNNPERSDVSFLVASEKLYGHKFVLALGSPVFDRMFFGELKERRAVIEIKDLPPIGFMNALSYIYGYPIDYELVDLYDSYVAADKYLLHSFDMAFFDYIKGKLTAESSCLIYDQLMKIGEREEISLASVRTMIIENSQEAIESDHFKQIDQETLISLLSLDELRIAEIDLLAAVSKWVDCEVKREGMLVNSKNRRKVFEPIKGYIVFTALTPENLADCTQVAELLTPEEIGSLVLYLLNNKENRLKIELKTSRKAGASVYSVLASDPLVIGTNSFSRKIALSADKKVSIRSISTSYPERAVNLNFAMVNSAGVALGLKINRSVKNGKLCLSFAPPLAIEVVNSSYTLQITGHDVLSNEGQLSRQRQLKYKESVTFGLSDYHCITALEFRLIE